MAETQLGKSEPKIYYSKISYWLLGSLIGLMLFIWAVPLYDKAPAQVSVIMSVVMFGSIGFIIHGFITTYYWVEKDQLRIKSGFMTNTSIPINRITKIKKTNSLLASPAGSFDRIEIFHGKWDSIIISPKDKTGLIAELQKVNPEIGVFV